jgi:DNA processing protein
MNDQTRKLRNCLWLSELKRQTGLRSADINRIMKLAGNLDELVSAIPSSLTEAVGGPPEKISRLATFLKSHRELDQLDARAQAAADQGIEALLFIDDDFPSRLKEIGSCPQVLYYRSEKYAEVMKSSCFVTVIGTRTPTAYGRIVAKKIAGDLAGQRIVIVSGLARGIDTVTHQAALEAGGLTIAVIGNGPDLAYPAENSRLMEEIAKRGLVISEHPPGTAPRKEFFPARNRIMSGLADAIAVIEASADSGTMITAGFAGDQGRDVYAVPGNILSPFSQGCNQLIREGAEVLTGAEDILNRLPAGQFQTRMECSIKRNCESSEAETTAGSEAADQLIIHILTGHSMTMAEISELAGLSLQDTAVQLTGMEVSGLLHCERGRYSLTRASLCCI